LIRFFVAIVAAALAIRLVVDLLKPIVPILVLLIVAFSLVQIIRWWRLNRW
jgi:hypothetical protein